MAVGLYDDWRSVDLEPQDRTMLEYVEKLTYMPSSTTEEDLEGLRQAGFTEENVVDIVMLTGYRAMLNRLHDGLGLTLEDTTSRLGTEFVGRFAGPDE